MKLPRNVNAEDLIAALTRLGYVAVRQTGSHVRMTIQRSGPQGGERHVSIRRHNPLRVGTLSCILAEVGGHLDLTKQQLLRELDL